MVFADLPYGTTRNKWDSVIDLQAMWIEFSRLVRGPILLTAQAPFDKVLWASNPKAFRYQWVWEKTLATGHLNAKKMPMKAHELVLVFYGKIPTYNPIKTTGHPRKVSTRQHDRNCKKTSNYGTYNKIDYNSTERYPRDVIKIKSDRQKSALHPTQKPVALSDYFIHTYSNPGDTVLDITMGSGSTGVSCKNLGRNFIGIENDENWFDVSNQRLIEKAP